VMIFFSMESRKYLTKKKNNNKKIK